MGVTVGTQAQVHTSARPLKTPTTQVPRPVRLRLEPHSDCQQKWTRDNSAQFPVQTAIHLKCTISRSDNCPITRWREWNLGDRTNNLLYFATSCVTLNLYLLHEMRQWWRSNMGERLSVAMGHFRAQTAPSQRANIFHVVSLAEPRGSPLLSSSPTQLILVFPLYTSGPVFTKHFILLRVLLGRGKSF